MSWTGDIQVFGTTAAVLAALAVPLTTFARRPRLSLATDEEGIQTRLEAGDIPWLRLLVKNRGRRRAAQGTRVLVEHYRANGSAAISMGSPELGWPSTEVREGGGVVVFAGGKRPLDFAHLVTVRRDASGAPVMTMADRDTILQSGGRWELMLALAMHGKGTFLADHRELLPPVDGGYTVRLLVGADDGAARIYDASVDWNGHAATAPEALASVRLALREARAGRDVTDKGVAGWRGWHRR